MNEREEDMTTKTATKKTAPRRSPKTQPPEPPPSLTLPSNVKPSKACSTDKTRPVVMNAYVRDTPRGPELHATDTYMAARVPLTVEGKLTEGFVPSDALKHVEADRKDRSFSTPNGRVEVEGGRISYARPDFGSFPDFETLWPNGEPKEPLVLGLNAKLLYGLAQALGTDRVKLTLDLSLSKDGSYLRPYRVQPLAGGVDGAEGLLMPIRVNT